METKEKFLTIEEYETALSYIDNPNHKLQFLLMGDGGLRVSEVTDLRWSHIDVRKKVITVQSLKKTENAKQKTRRVPMAARLYNALVEMVAKNGKGVGWVFPGQGGKKQIERVTINNWIKRLCADHPDLPYIYPHLLRHTFATNLRIQGASIAEIQNLLGHEDVDTTMIYAHADIEHQRRLINASTPRPSFWTRIRNRWFPAIKPEIRLPAVITPDLVGRDVEAKQVEKLMHQKVSTVVVGPMGIGKTYLIDSLTFTLPILEMDDTKDFKKSLASCLIHLLGSKEQVAALIYGTTAPDSLRVKVSKESVPNLCKLMIESCDPKSYILKIGEIDSVTPSIVRALELLKTHFVILTTSRFIKMDKASVVSDSEKITLKPLPRQDSLQLFHRLMDGVTLSGLDWIQNKIYDTSEGNPRMIVELAERIRRMDYVDQFVVDEICNNYLGRQSREIDVSPYLLLGFGSLVILKYIGRESGESALTFIGSAVMIVMLFARYFFRGARRKSL